ncbi:Dimeric alpha-beta barrel, partial [Venturia nashicola]
MYIVSPLSRCASAEKRDVFFDHIARIAPVAYEDEPGCVGYAWFRSTKENDTIPLHWCRGFE